MQDEKIVSSDSHVVEPPDTWNGRLPARYRDRAPRVVGDADGDWWFVDGARENAIVAPSADAVGANAFSEPAICCRPEPFGCIFQIASGPLLFEEKKIPLLVHVG